MKNLKLKHKTYKLAVFAIASVILSALFLTAAQAQNQENSKKEVYLHVFYGQGCPHCSSLLSFLDNAKNNYPTLKIYQHEVYQNNQARKLFEELADKFNTEIEGVPTAFINDKVIVGFSNEIAVSLENEIKKCLIEECGNPVEKILGVSSSKKLTIPIVIGAAAVDAINPCAFAVLIILMTAALSITDKKRALKFGLAFTCSIYISYFLMGLGLFFVLQATGLSHNFYIFATILAVLVALFNIKDYFWYGKGFLMEIPLSWRPLMKKILNSATTPFGAFVAGFIVSSFELPCTGGPYIVILGLLAKEVTRSTGIFYLLLYNLIFVFPLIILSLIIYKGLSTTGKLEAIRQKRIKLLHLISGLLMLGIATMMILSLIKGQV